MFRSLAFNVFPAMLLAAVPAAPALADPAAIPAESPQALPSAGPVEEPSLPPKKVCKSIVYTGSRLPAKKVCKTKEEWDALTAETQDDMRDRQRASRNWKPGSD